MKSKNNKNKIKKTRKQLFVKKRFPQTKRKFRLTKRRMRYEPLPIKKLKKLKGGKVIGAGGFGCVFKPALNCMESKEKKGDRNNPAEPGKVFRSENLISKLLTIQTANKEWEEVDDIKDRLRDIPNSQNYFILPIEKCFPQELKEHDAENLRVCFENQWPDQWPEWWLELPPPQLDRRIKEVLNKEIHNYNIIQNLYGGRDISQFLGFLRLGEESAADKTETLTKIFPNLNTSLTSLLINGIEPMNEAHIFHRDIKANNIVYDNTDARLIDWGFATDNVEGLEFEKPAGAIMFNCPLTTILFNKRVKRHIQELYNDKAREDFFDSLIKLKDRKELEAAEAVEKAAVEEGKTWLQSKLYDFIKNEIEANDGVWRRLSRHSRHVIEIFNFCKTAIPEKYRNSVEQVEEHRTTKEEAEAARQAWQEAVARARAAEGAGRGYGREDIIAAAKAEAARKAAEKAAVEATRVLEAAEKRAIEGYFKLIADQCTEVIIKYTIPEDETFKLDFDNFIKDVYSKNVDIFGWMITYEILLQSYLSIDIASLFAKYLYSIEYAAKAYVPQLIVDDFLKLNSIPAIPQHPNCRPCPPLSASAANVSAALKTKYWLQRFSKQLKCCGGGKRKSKKRKSRRKKRKNKRKTRK